MILLIGLIFSIILRLPEYWARIFIGAINLLIFSVQYGLYLIYGECNGKFRICFYPDDQINRFQALAVCVPECEKILDLAEANNAAVYTGAYPPADSTCYPWRLPDGVYLLHYILHSALYC